MPSESNPSPAAMKLAEVLFDKSHFLHKRRYPQLLITFARLIAEWKKEQDDAE